MYLNRVPTTICGNIPDSTKPKQETINHVMSGILANNSQNIFIATEFYKTLGTKYYNSTITIVYSKY